MDGYEVARRIRAAGDGPSLVAFTGSNDERAGDGTFDAYVLKATDPEALRRAVEGAVKARA